MSLRSSALVLALCGLLAPAAQAAAPLTPEFRVNDSAFGSQDFPAIAADANGRYAVAFASSSSVATGSWEGIYLRRVNAAGTPVGPDVQVAATDEPRRPAIAMDPDGDLIVAWVDGENDELLARRYDARGIPGPAVSIANAVYDHQSFAAPALGVDADGDAVIAWFREDGGNYRAFFRRWPAGGAPTAAAWVTDAGAVQEEPSVGLAPGGTFVIAWAQGNVGAQEIRARRFAGSGAPLGADFAVHAPYDADDDEAVVAVAPGGALTIAWDRNRSTMSNAQDPFMRRFDAAGTALGEPQQLNAVGVAADGAVDGIEPAIAVDAGGDIVAAWTSRGGQGGGDAQEVYLRRFGPNGVPLTGELRANETTDIDQRDPVVAAAPDGGFLVAWHDESLEHGPATIYDVWARLYGMAPPSPPPPPSGPTPPAPPTTPTPPSGPGAATLPKASAVIRFPSAKRCASRRSFSIPLARSGLEIASVTVTLDGRRLGVLRGKRIGSRVTVRGLPRGRHTLKIVAALQEGRTLSAKRRYRTCAKRVRGAGTPRLG